MPVLAFFSFGAMELLLIVAAAALLVWPAWRVCVKAGFPGPLGVLVVIPVFNLVLLYLLAFAEWPALRRGPAYHKGDELP